MALPNTLTPSQKGYLKTLDAVVPAAEDGHGDGCDDSDQDSGIKNIIDGTNQSDILTGEEGRDLISGFNGDDELYGRAGADKLLGGNGEDLLDGGEGRDYLYGGNGNDELRGGKGKDDIYGENGNDLLIGGCGPDLLDGGRGDDILNGGNAPDIMIGGPGSDIFVLSLPGEGGGHTGEDGGHSGGSGGNGGHTDDGHTESEADIIQDFTQGTDFLALVGSLSFDDLNFQGNDILVGDHRILATLSGFDTTQLIRADFVLV